MRVLCLLSLCLLTDICHGRVNFTCPVGCECSRCNGVDKLMNLRCNFTKLPNVWLPNELCSLSLSNNAIISLEGWKFGNLSRLQNMSLSKNSIVTLPGNAFVNLSSLKHLHLNSNRIKTIQHNAFKGLHSLESLFLDRNELISLAQGTFQGLYSLRYLGLSYNKLTLWRGILSNELPRLIHFNIGGNPNLELTETLLVNSSVQTISGATISNKCSECQLYRANVSRKRLLPKRGCQYVPDEYSYMLDQYEKSFVLFKGKCGSIQCELSLTDIDPIRKIYIDMCWAKVREVRAVEYILGSAAILLNACVIAGTLSSKQLRKKTSFALIAHLAFCDLLLGIYSISVATGHGINHDPSFRKWRVTHCPYYRNVFVLGQTMGVITALLMTADRYLALVHCMNPSLRMTLKTALLLLGFSWCGTGVFCYLIQLIDNSLIRDNFMCILVQNIKESKRFFFSQAQMLFCVVLYMVVIVLYVRIYIYAKKSAATAGVRRETSLAVRIGVIVLSNIIFFVVPNIFFVVFTAGMLNVSTKPITNTLVRIWSAPVCMTVSACVNPILFALRNEQFTLKVKRYFSRLLWRKTDLEECTGVRQLGVTNQAASQIVFPASIELQIR